MRRSLFALAIVLASTACVVKKSTYQKMVADRDAQASHARQLQDQLDQEKAARSGAEADLTRVQGEADASAADLEEVKAQREADQKRLAAYQDLQDRFKALVDSGALEISYRHGQMTLKLPSGVLFPSAGADLSDGGKKTLDKVIKVLATFPDRRFLIAGHTD